MTLIKRTTSIIGIFCLIALLVTSVQAAENGVLYVTNASDVEPDSSSTVRIYLDNAFEPPCGAAQFKLYYNNSIIQADSVSVTTGGVIPKNLQSPITFAFATTSGIPNGDAWLANITFKALNTDGSTSELGLTLEELNDIAIPPKSLTSTCRIQNGTFSTRNVPVLPVANFTANVTAGTAPLAVRFTDISTGNPTAWLWSFGDGATSNEQHPTYTYTATGTYTVTLNASNAHGYSISAPTTITVQAPTPTAGLLFIPGIATISPGDTTPYAMVINSVPAGLSGFNISVALTDPSVGEIVGVSYPAWAMMPKNGSLPADSVFVQAVDLEQLIGVGATNVTLCTLTIRGDAAGTTNLTITPIKVDDDLAGRYAPGTTDAMLVVEGSPAPVIANFTANATVGNAPLAVQFTDQSTGNVTAWLWNFGDGNTSTVKNPIHTYVTAGNYTVTLNASNTYGFSNATRANYITVLAPPVANFTANVTAGPAPLAVQFTDNSTGEIATRLWNFGDGATSTEQNPIHTYTTPGTYTARLTITGPGGNAIAERTITVTPSTTGASFTADVTAGTIPLTARFTDTSTGDPTSWSWSFGDGNTSTKQHPVHTYTVPGNHTVTLTVDGGLSTATKPSYIKVTPVLFGDANEDGKVNQADTLTVLQEVVGLREQPDTDTEQFRKTDVRANNVIEVGDALFIAQYNVGLRDIWFEVI